MVDPLYLVQQLCFPWAARAAGPLSQASGKGWGRDAKVGKGELSTSPCAHSEVKLSVVTYLTNSIVDEILQELYHSHKSLARHLAQLRTLSDPPGGPGQGQDLSSRGRGRNHDHEETTDDELGTNIVSTPTPLLNLGPASEPANHRPFLRPWTPPSAPHWVSSPHPDPTQPLPLSHCLGCLRTGRHDGP